MLAVLSALILCGCALLTDGRTQSRASSGLVGFLYPRGEMPPREDAIPELQLPLRVGLAFLPEQGGRAVGLEATRREELLGRIRQRFADRKFVSQIVVIPDYYLEGGAGFRSLEGVQRLYDVDVMALVSYDQVSYRDENDWSLGYLTIVGAYVLKGSRQDVTTLMDLAVIDPVSRSILLRAGGTDSRHGTSTMVAEAREWREARTKGFSGATDHLIENFDAALTKFESDVREGKANVRVAHREGSTGGGGALDAWWLTLLLALIAARRLPLSRSRAGAPH